MSQTYIKLLRAGMCHHGHVYTAGRNVAAQPWSPDECAGGGLFVCERQHVAHWMALYPDLQWFCVARLPAGAKASAFTLKVKASELELSEQRPLEDLGLTLDDVAQCGACLNFVRPELRMEAITKDGLLLRHVKEALQTRDLCLAAVNSNWRAITTIKSASMRDDPEICDVVVRHCRSDPSALAFVRQTPERCMAAVVHNGLTLKYVQDQTPAICEAACGQTPRARFLVTPEARARCLVHLYERLDRLYGVS